MSGLGCLARLLRIWKYPGNRDNSLWVPEKAKALLLQGFLKV